MLAYSSVSQFGLVIAGFAIATPLAVVGATVHLVGHAVMKGGLFAVTGIIERKTGATTVGGYAGMGGRVPVAAGVFTLLALGMVGVPPAIGFVGKWYIVLGAVEAGIWPVVVVLLASTLLTLAYFARLGERLFFAEPTIALESAAATDGGERVSTGMIVTVVVAALLAVGLTAAVPVIDQLIDQTVFELILQ
jgi:multicomponent Na+:H+ antiporter subunit D